MSKTLNTTSAFGFLVNAARAHPPRIALVLGSGMGEVATNVPILAEASFGQVPGLRPTSIEGHCGKLTLREWAGQRLLIFEGRLHFYEGHPWRTVSAPVNMAAFLGAQILLLTNAAGGIHPQFGPGSLMVIQDHIEWTRAYCWRLAGPHALQPDRESPYSKRLNDFLMQASQASGILLRQGTYAATTGPCYETPAEIRALREWGADAVGMSTTREVQIAHALGIECAAISCITNAAAGLNERPINHLEVLQSSAAQASQIQMLLQEFLQLLP